jgi:hypothetical protein
VIAVAASEPQEGRSHRREGLYGGDLAPRTDFWRRDDDGHAFDRNPEGEQLSSYVVERFEDLRI